MNYTIHIFGYGEAQIISKDINYKAKTSAFSKLQAVIDNIKSKKPADKIMADFHCINIFGDNQVMYMSKKTDKNTDIKKSSYSLKISDIDNSKLKALVLEFGTLSKS